MRRNLHRTLALPANVRADQIAWTPDIDEMNWTRWRAAEQQIRLDAIHEQREWLAQQTQRLAVIALEIDEGLRKAALQEALDRQDAWWATEAEREKEATARLMDSYQKQLDAATYSKLLARVTAAAEDIRKTDYRIEKAELLKRGVVRGLRG